jgi:gas vesicle protein
LLLGSKTLNPVDTFWAGLIGALVGGLFTLLGAWLQGRSTVRASRAQAEATDALATRQREAELRQAAHLEVLRVLASSWTRWSDEDAEAARAVGVDLNHVVTVYGPFISKDLFDPLSELMQAVHYEDSRTPTRY